MNATLKQPSMTILRQLTLVILSTGFIIGSAKTSWAQGDTVVVSKKVKVNAKGDIVIGPKNVTAAKGVATTTFNFHPVDIVNTDYTKNAATLVINPNPFTVNYTETELHGTTGSAVYNLTLAAVRNNQGLITGYVVGGTATPTIKPGGPPKLPVSIVADVKDPFIFSSSLDSQFDFVPGGMDLSLTLDPGTAFPAQFDPAGTSMTFVARVAPGEVSDPEAFWSSSLTGAVDLYQLVITSDASYNITAQLTFGGSTPSFLVDSSPNVSAIETAIENAFDANGMVTASLNDVFTAGFVPSGLSAFTVGTRELAQISGHEVPEPATLALLLTSSVFVALKRRRRDGGIASR